MYDLTTILSFSILIGAVIGWIRFKKINPAYYPFIYLIWIGLLTEIVNFFLIKFHGNNVIVSNIYSLLEAIFYTWQFTKWRIISKRFCFVLIPAFIIFWIIEMFTVSLSQVQIYFRLSYAFVIVLMSVSAINRLIFTERKNILKNSIFLISISCIVYFTVTVLIWAFWLYGTKVSQQFSGNLYGIHTWINLFTNLIFALAILWMPSRQRFSLPS